MRDNNIGDKLLGGDLQSIASLFAYYQDLHHRSL
jgi:hypothetical protein